MESIEILNNLDHNLKNDSKNEIKKNKNRCKAGVRHTTRGSAYRSISDGIEVYLIDVNKDGNIKTNAYSPCMKTMQFGHDYCHIHLNTFQKNNSSVKNFEIDILPINESDKSRRLANINDPYFNEMGKRGANKKKTVTTYTFPDEKHPILLILNHKDAKLNTILTLYATQLLKGNPKDIAEFKKVKSSNPFDKISFANFDGIMNDLKKDDIESSFKKSISLSAIHSNIDNEESEPEIDEESEPEINEESEPEIDQESDEESDQESDKQSVDCITVYTKDKKELFYNPENNIVYRMECNGDGTELGLFKKVSKSNYYIKHEKRHYTIVIKNGDGYKCIFSEKIFDEDMNPI